MNHKTIIIGVAGPTASGKSLLANTIVEELGCDQVEIISEDAYYCDQKHMPFDERLKTNYDHPNAFEHDLLIKHLQALQAGNSIELPMYDFTNHVRSDKTRTIGSKHIIVIEGILLFVDKALRDMMDIRLFMDTPLDICLLRRLKRDIIKRGRSIESVMEQYQETVRPMYLQFVEPSKRYADVIVPRGGENRIAIEMVQAKMRELLTKANIAV
ncbi:MAG: uridine kinase [Coxiellaceae bacterium]|nr:uridine kinase [Coxiellaceae bacterium]